MKNEELQKAQVKSDAGRAVKAGNSNDTSNSPFMLFAIMTAAVILITGIICAVVLINGNKEDKPDASSGTAVSSSEGAGSAASDNTSDERIKLLHKEGTYEAPDDTVVISLHISSLQYLDGYSGLYVPEDQKAWKDAINKALEKVKDKKYTTFPDNELLPVTVYWRAHDGGTGDWWRLNYNGSLWGEHMEGGVSKTYKNNYIAREDGEELAALIKQTCEVFGINPIQPEQIGNISSAELILNGKTYTLEDRVKLGYLSDTLKNAKSVDSSSCGWAMLKMTRSDGKVIVLSLARDGCGVWHSDGKYYRYGDAQTARSIYSLFGVDLSKIH